MKLLRSSIGDLRRTFDDGLCVRHIAEPFSSFDADRPPEQVKRFLDQHGYDVVGVRLEGNLIGYVRREDLGAATLAEVVRPLDSTVLVADTEPLLGVFEWLRQRRWLLVGTRGHAWGIVTRGDAQKAPVRMWLFGLVTLAEMHLLRLVRECYPSDTWREQHLLSPGRQKEAERLFEKRRHGNEETDLTDCLQLCDKVTILKKYESVFAHMGFPSKAGADAFFRRVEQLRNLLAHSRDIVTQDWEGLAELVLDLEHFLTRCEELHIR
jgi:hypothetical protein